MKKKGLEKSKSFLFHVRIHELLAKALLVRKLNNLALYLFYQMVVLNLFG